jgi:hypothetical protein
MRGKHLEDREGHLRLLADRVFYRIWCSEEVRRQPEAQGQQEEQEQLKFGLDSRENCFAWKRHTLLNTLALKWHKLAIPKLHRTFTLSNLMIKHDLLTSKLSLSIAPQAESYLQLILLQKPQYIPHIQNNARHPTSRFTQQT